LVSLCLHQRIAALDRAPSSAARIKEATVDNRRKDALTSFSGWWRSWPLLASGGHDAVERPSTESDLDESVDFVIWAAELAAPGDGPTGGADRR
jgi:hypothetical protein